VHLELQEASGGAGPRLPPAWWVDLLATTDLAFAAMEAMSIPFTAHPAPVTALPMIIRWISEVPSNMVKSSDVGASVRELRSEFGA